jgi:hypothetical protein
MCISLVIGVIFVKSTNPLLAALGKIGIALFFGILLSVTIACLALIGIAQAVTVSSTPKTAMQVAGVLLGIAGTIIVFLATYA